MARINYPQDFLAQQSLFYSIKTKNDADGVNSVLTAFMAQQNIDLDADATAAADAKTLDDNRILLSNQSENYTQLRNNAFNPVFARLKAEVQFLKSFYKGNVHTLGDWGITVTGDNRIVYPPSFEERLIVFNNFVAKHQSYPKGDSPLDPYIIQQNINVANDATAAADANTYNTQSKQSAADSENSTEQRDLAWSPVLAHVKLIGDYLKKLFSNNPKNLGLWGFTVDDSPQKPALRTTKLLPGETKVIKGIAIGSIFSNIGTSTLSILKGVNGKATTDLIAPGTKLGMVKGFSTITVTNTSTLEEGEFTVERK